MRLRDRRNRHDSLYRRAKSEGFAARSVYKLEEIDRRLGLIHPGDRVLDLGCWPGSWLQYLEKKVGPLGRIVGVDRKPPERSFGSHVRIEVGDVLVMDSHRLLGDLESYDVVLSDLAPATTGVRLRDQALSAELLSRALQLAEAVLRRGGHFVGKVFSSPDVAELRSRMSPMFDQVKELHPEGSRKGSSEVYLAGLRRRSKAALGPSKHNP